MNHSRLESQASEKSEERIKVDTDKKKVTVFWLSLLVNHRSSLLFNEVLIIMKIQGSYESL